MYNPGYKQTANFIPNFVTVSKKRVVKDYDALPEEIIRDIKLAYPTGFASNLVSYLNKEGKKVSALPFETEEVYYLIRMTVLEAEQLIQDDDDYDDDGVLREDFEDINLVDEYQGTVDEDDDGSTVDEDDHIIETGDRDDDDEAADVPDDTKY